jgi:ketosteroid isomerase-like protein
MSSEDEHVALLREAYRHWAESKATSIDRWLDFADDEIHLWSLAEGAPGLEFTTAKNGKQEVRAYLEGVPVDWEMISLEVTDYIAQADRVVAIIRSAWRNRRTGKVVDMPKVDVWRFRGGRAVEFHEYFDTARCIAATQP